MHNEIIFSSTKLTAGEKEGFVIKMVKKGFVIKMVKKGFVIKKVKKKVLTIFFGFKVFFLKKLEKRFLVKRVPLKGFFWYARSSHKILKFKIHKWKVCG